ncbi:pentatricopeptide repeat-containing protein [Pyrus ussuriensis x Pyrus communis]|uniref:Pentatricopeptide repeat-containing protein n=1 Tax=Pyrus ussuriensis x Pyrus communis TaxID=2448454 RepID=A0A5N5FVV9_9ROSA|nr:pentatricopeptide repeat-containing protein [Pyrus ussuriensis x Pyrus communis]
MEALATPKIIVAYSSLLSLHTIIGDKEGVRRIWKKVKLFLKKLGNCILNGSPFSGTRDPRVSNILLAAYINEDQMKRAETFHNLMVRNGIKPCYKQEHTEKALEYFKKAVGGVKRWDPNKRLIGEVFDRLKEKNHIQGGEELLVRV